MMTKLSNRIQYKGTKLKLNIITLNNCQQWLCLCYHKNKTYVEKKTIKILGIY